MNLKTLYGLGWFDVTPIVSYLYSGIDSVCAQIRVCLWGWAYPITAPHLSLVRLWSDYAVRSVVVYILCVISILKKFFLVAVHLKIPSLEITHGCCCERSHTCWEKLFAARGVANHTSWVCTYRQTGYFTLICLFLQKNFKFTPFRCLRPQKHFTLLWSPDAQCRSWYGGNIFYCKQKTSVCGTFLKNYFCLCLSFAILCIRQMDDGWIDRLIV